MAALNSEGEAQKLRFGPWLVRAIDSGSYRGLRWINAERRAFRVPWKHNARKDVTSSDLEVFRAWAQVSGRYEGSPEDPAKWKTNFRCALRSTHMFELLEDNSKSGDDPHKVFAITPAALCPSEEGDFGSPDPAAEQQSRLVLAPLDVAPEITPPGTAAPTPSPLLEDMEVLQWVLKKCNISPHDFGTLTSSWPPAGDAPYQDTLLQPLPGPGQDDPLTPPAVQDWVSLEQPLVGACSPPDPMLLGEQGGCCGAGCSPRYESALMGWEEASPPQSDGHPAAPQMAMPAHPPQPTVPEPPPGEAVPFIPATHPVPAPLEDSTDGNVPILDVSIYYRGKLFHQEEVRGRQCLLLYQPSDPALVLRPGHRVGFPSPSKLADDKQRRFTEELLGCVGLQLEQRARKLFATRLKKCKVFWALSQQLEGPGDPPSNLLCRDQEIPIFDFNKFCTELRDFRNGQRKRSPDFTIYLCFGQSFSRARPKESRLILVKLVPKFCEHWYEQVLREGASSLDSGTISLQLSDSFSLFELIEQCNMQID